MNQNELQTCFPQQLTGMGARRNFCRGGKPQKGPHDGEKSSKKAHTWCKKPHIMRNT